MNNQTENKTSRYKDEWKFWVFIGISCMAWTAGIALLCLALIVK